MKINKCYIAYLAALSLLTIGGITLPQMYPTSHQSIAQADDTPSTNFTMSGPGLPSVGYALPLSSAPNPPVLGKFITADETFGNMKQGTFLENYRLISEVANNTLTAGQAALIFYHLTNIGSVSALTDLFNNDAEIFKKENSEIDEPTLQSQLKTYVITYKDVPGGDPASNYTVPTRAINTHTRITYKTNDGTDLPEKVFQDINATITGNTASKVITGISGNTYQDDNHTLIPEISGYTASANSVTFENGGDSTKEQAVTITYTKNSSPATSAPNASQSFRVYGKQKLYRYQHVDFKKSERIRKYATKPSAYAPVFTVVNTTQSKAGNPRYELSDGSYITAKSAYVGKLFLEDETAKTLYVTNPKGIWTHTATDFSDQLNHLKQGSKVAVTKLVKDGDTTRYQLANGTYVTGNQRYVTTDKPQWVTRVKAEGGRNLYSDVDLTHRLKHYRKGHIFTVKGWDYSYGHNQLISGTKRYKISGGYITGNPKLVKIIK